MTFVSKIEKTLLTAVIRQNKMRNKTEYKVQFFKNVTLYLLCVLRTCCQRQSIASNKHS